MNERIKKLVKNSGGHISVRNLMSNPPQQVETVELWDDKIQKFAELIVEETLKQVDERTYCRGETSWYNDDKDWVRLHFGYGKFVK